MGRRIPTYESPSIHPVLSLSFLAAWVAATIAVITALCVARSRKKNSSPSSSASPHKTMEKSDVVTPPPPATVATLMPPPLPTATTVQVDDTTEKKLPQIQELQQPPPIHKLKESYSHSDLTKSSSKRKLMVSLSMKMPGGGLAAKHLAKREEQQQRKREKLKREDSIWMKTIILGERCKVPNEDDAVIYDDKGNRITTYHPKTPRSLPVSRTTSFIDPDALPF